MDAERVLTGRFELERRVGQGGGGEIYRALDRETGQPVAIKFLREMEEQMRTRFAREIEMLSALEHPGIVRYLGHGLTLRGVPYLAMEWLAGEDLHTRLRRRRLTLLETIELGRCVATALAEAHRRGIVHRDLKPSNLFLPAGCPERVKILDFGIAYEPARTALTQPGHIVGTPGYMAPEQIQGTGQPTPRSDVFSLGCVLFECLAGEAAFDSEHPMARLAKILFEDPPRLAMRRPGVPAALDALVMQMLVKVPEARPTDAAAVAEALTRLQAKLSEEAPVSPPVEGSLPGGSEMIRPVSLALTDRERWLVTVLLVGAEQRRGEDEAALAEQATIQAKATVGGAAALGEEGEEVTRTLEGQRGPRPPELPAVRDLVRSEGGDLEVLLDGSLAIRLVESEGTVNQVARTARCALALRPLLPGRAMALAMGPMWEGQAETARPFGAAFDRAARLLAHPAATTGVVTDEPTAALLEACLEVETQAEAFLLKNVRADIFPAERRLLGKTVDCVGRERELGMLTGLFESCIEEGRAGAVVISGPAGMGKSRLVHEFIQRLRQRDDATAIWIGRSGALRSGSALALLRDALQGACGIRESDALEVRRARLGERVAARLGEPERSRVTEFLGELLGIPPAGEGSPLLRSARQDARLLGEQLRAAWLAFLGAECAVHPVLLVLEDLQWGDLPTLNLVDVALRELGELPWMVLGLGRPEMLDRFPKLWVGRNTQHLHLGPLSRRASIALVRRALGAEASEETVERLAVRSDGHAFFLEELIRATANGEHMALPDTVMAMVQARLGRLAAEERRVLRAASVFGEVFWRDGVAALLGEAVPQAELGEQLERLEGREFIVRHAESRFAGEEEFAFRHALVREGAHAMLTAEDLTTGHRLAAHFLEQVGESDPLVLAQHWEQGDVPARAAEFYLVAAERALASGDGETALSHAQRGLAGAQVPEVRGALLYALCEARLVRGEWADGSGGVRLIEEVLAVAPPGSRAWYLAAGYRTFVLVAMGGTAAEREFERLYEMMMNVEPAAGITAAVASTLGHLGFAYGLLGRFDRTLCLVERLCRVVEPVSDREPLARAWMYFHLANTWGIWLGEPWRGQGWAERAITSFREAGLITGEEQSRTILGGCRWLLGDFERALATLREGCKSGTLDRLRQSFVAEAFRAIGALDEARAAVEEMKAQAATRLEQGLARWGLAEVLCDEGQLEPAEREVREALELLMPYPPYQAFSLATLARILLVAGRAGESLACARQALALYEWSPRFGIFAMKTQLVHAEALHAVGEVEAARAALARSARLLEERAERIEDAGWRRSYLENVDEHARILALGKSWGVWPERKA
jgi:tetratricopeptide (TPR) repeat protein